MTTTTTTTTTMKTTDDDNGIDCGGVTRWCMAWLFLHDACLFAGASAPVFCCCFDALLATWLRSLAPPADAPLRDFPYEVQRSVGGPGVGKVAAAVQAANMSRIKELLSKGPDDPELLSRLILVPPPPLQAGLAGAPGGGAGAGATMVALTQAHAGPWSSSANWRAPLVVRGCPVPFRDGLVLQHFLRDGYNYEKLRQRQEQQQQQQQQQPQHASGSGGGREISLGGDFDAPTVAGSYVIYYHFHPTPQDLMPVQVVAKKTMAVGFRAAGSILADALQFAPDNNDHIHGTTTTTTTVASVGSAVGPHDGKGGKAEEGGGGGDDGKDGGGRKGNAEGGGRGRGGGGGGEEEGEGEEEEGDAPGEWKRWASIRDMLPSATTSGPAAADHLELNFRQLQPGK